MASSSQAEHGDRGWLQLLECSARESSTPLEEGHEPKTFVFPRWTPDLCSLVLTNTSPPSGLRSCKRLDSHQFARFPQTLPTCAEARIITVACLDLIPDVRNDEMAVLPIGSLRTLRFESHSLPPTVPRDARIVHMDDVRMLEELVSPSTSAGQPSHTASPREMSQAGGKGVLNDVPQRYRPAIVLRSGRASPVSAGRWRFWPVSLCYQPIAKATLAFTSDQEHAVGYLPSRAVGVSSLMSRDQSLEM